MVPRVLAFFFCLLLLFSGVVSAAPAAAGGDGKPAVHAWVGEATQAIQAGAATAQEAMADELGQVHSDSLTDLPEVLQGSSTGPALTQIVDRLRPTAFADRASPSLDGLQRPPDAPRDST